MKKTPYILIVLLFHGTLLAQSEFMKMCQHPTASQLISLHAIMQKKEVSYISKERCEELEEGFYEAKHIFVRDSNITDLTPFRFFKNLISLDISNNSVSDLTPLSHLTKLEELDLLDNPITDLKPIENLKLKILRINSNIAFDLSPISNITSLENLFLLGDHQILPDLSKLVHLKRSYLINVDITDFCKFKNSKELTYLSISSKNLSSLKCVENFQNLEELEIESSSITDLSPLQTLKKLKKLSLTKVPVSDVTPLAKLPNLKTFAFYETNIKYLSPLRESQSLEYVMNYSRYKLFTTHILQGGLQTWVETVGKRSLASCSPIDIDEIREGKSCFEKDGILKPWWKRVLGL